MDLNNITPNIITEKFCKWLNRWVCNVLREHNQTGKVIVDRINIQERPKNIYEVKKFISKLEYLLPKEEGVTSVDWYFKFRRDIRRWKSISERLSAKDFIDVRVKDLVEYMIDDVSKLEELIDIAMLMDIKNV